jgi:hypothetical protein
VAMLPIDDVDAGDEAFIPCESVQSFLRLLGTDDP